MSDQAPGPDLDATVVRPAMAVQEWQEEDADYLAPEAGGSGRLTTFLAAALILAIGIVIGIQLSRVLG